MPKRYGQPCPVAKTLELIGDRWTLLLVRDLLPGTRRFQDLLTSLSGIAPNILSDRLKLMEEHGLVSRRLYSEHPPRADTSSPRGARSWAWSSARSPPGARATCTSGRTLSTGLRASREARLLLPGLRPARARRRRPPRARAAPREGRVGLILSVVPVNATRGAADAGRRGPVPVALATPDARAADRPPT